VVCVENLVIARAALCMGEIFKSVMAQEVSLLQSNAFDKDIPLPFPLCYCSCSLLQMLPL